MVELVTGERELKLKGAGSANEHWSNYIAMDKAE